MVVLPDHLPAVWRLPEGDADFPLRLGKLKARFGRSVGGSYRRSDSKIAKGERGLWQRRYWEHMIRDGDDWRRHVEYRWNQPGEARAGRCGAGLAADVLPSRRAARDLGADWARDATEGDFGEREGLGKWWVNHPPHASE